jgi:hypothetical protein
MLLFHVIHTSYEHGLKIFEIIQGVWCIGGNTNLYFFKWNTQYFFAFLESSRQNIEEEPHLMGLTSTDSKLFALLCPDKPNFENL